MNIINDVQIVINAIVLLVGAAASWFISLYNFRRQLSINKDKDAVDEGGARQALVQHINYLSQQFTEMSVKFVEIQQKYTQVESELYTRRAELDRLTATLEEMKEKNAALASSIKNQSSVVLSVKRENEQYLRQVAELQQKLSQYER